MSTDVMSYAEMVERPNRWYVQVLDDGSYGVQRNEVPMRCVDGVVWSHTLLRVAARVAHTANEDGYKPPVLDRLAFSKWDYETLEEIQSADVARWFRPLT